MVRKGTAEIGDAADAADTVAASLADEPKQNTAMVLVVKAFSIKGGLGSSEQARTKLQHQNQKKKKKKNKREEKK